MCTKEFILTELDSYNSYLILNHYSEKVIYSYKNRVRNFLKDYLDESNQEELQESINSYSDFIPLMSKHPTQAALHAYYRHKTGLDFQVRVTATSFKENISIEAEIKQFEKYLIEYRHLAKNTITTHVNTIRIFLYCIFKGNDVNVTSIHAGLVRDFLSDTLRHVSPSSRKTLVARIRNFIHYLEYSYNFDAEEILKLPMSAPVWKRNSIPKYMDKADIIKLENAYDCSKKNGKRDYAIFRCLKDLGLRCAETASISLDDFDWQEGIITIRAGKSHSQRMLPLPMQTGTAIIEYLTRERLKSETKVLFLRSKSKTGEPMGTSQVRCSVRSAAIRAGLNKFSGTHMLRHSAAKDMINSGIDIKVIADVLGHDSIETSMIYSKIDFHGLRIVAAAWPEVKEC